MKLMTMMMMRVKSAGQRNECVIFPRLAAISRRMFGPAAFALFFFIYLKKKITK